MTPRYNRARLITEDDRHYRKFLEQVMLSKQNQRAMRPPRDRDLFGGEAEQALRSWLAQRWELSDRRILEYEERRGHSWTRKYRELDAVVLDGRRIHVFEIKASKTAKALLRATAQLDETRQILSLLFQHVTTTILFVNTGIPGAEEVAEIMAGPEPPAKPPLTLAEALAAQPSLHVASSLDELKLDPGSTNLLLKDTNAVIELVGAENLHLNWDVDEEQTLAPNEELSIGPAAEPQADEAAPSEEDSPFALAMKKALERRGKG